MTASRHMNNGRRARRLRRNVLETIRSSFALSAPLPHNTVCGLVVGSHDGETYWPLATVVMSTPEESDDPTEHVRSVIVEHRQTGLTVADLAAQSGVELDGDVEAVAAFRIHGARDLGVELSFGEAQYTGASVEVAFPDLSTATFLITEADRGYPVVFALASAPVDDIELLPGRPTGEIEGFASPSLLLAAATEPLDRLEYLS